MPRTTSRCRAVGFALLMAAMMLTGCAQPRMFTKQQEQAVSLYVDAMMLNDLNEHEKAIEKLNAAVLLDPEFALAYSMKGDIYQKLQQYEKSAEAYEAATTMDPWSFKDFFNLGKVTQVMKQWTRAIKAYVRACELEPQHYEAHISAAKCYYETEDYEQAALIRDEIKGLEAALRNSGRELD